MGIVLTGEKKLLSINIFCFFKNKPFYYCNPINYYKGFIKKIKNRKLIFQEVSLELVIFILQLISKRNMVKLKSHFFCTEIQREKVFPSPVFLRADFHYFLHCVLQDEDSISILHLLISLHVSNLTAISRTTRS